MRLSARGRTCGAVLDAVARGVGVGWGWGGAEGMDFWDGG
jgi:hypothetical protein